MSDPNPVPDLLPVTGGCLCGHVRYEARPTHRDGYYCHCRMCQIAFGNTRAAFFNLRKDQVRWTGAAPKRHASSAIAQRGFCDRCGTPLTFDFPDSEHMDLAIGSLDDPSAFAPGEHVAVESRIERWHAPDGLPEKRLDEVTAITERWRRAYGNDVVPGVDVARRPRQPTVGQSG